MRIKLVILSQSGVSGASYVEALDMDNVTKEEITKKLQPQGKLHWFSDDEEHDGSMKTGTIKIELADDTYTFNFAKTTGAAKHGIDSKKIYNNGILEKGGDDKYKVVEYDGKQYLVGTTGSIVTSGGRYKDANDLYYIVKKGGSIDKGYEIYRTSDEDTAKGVVNGKIPYESLQKADASTTVDK